LPLSATPPSSPFPRFSPRQKIPISQTPSPHKERLAPFLHGPEPGSGPAGSRVDRQETWQRPLVVPGDKASISSLHMAATHCRLQGESCALSSDVHTHTRQFAWVPGVPGQQNWPDNVR
jgi:hypothetical protein